MISTLNSLILDFTKLGPVGGDRTHVSTRVMGTHDHVMSGKLTVKCDVYSFGAVLSEPIT